MYKTNITFNTNVLKLLLSIVISINNTSSTFLAVTALTRRVLTRPGFPGYGP
jgi:hypothetical protein